MAAPSHKHIYLIGFMGTGKSTLGRLLADTLDIPFVDSDDAIEQKEGISIPEIFEKYGEDHFRKLERKFIENDDTREPCVISCGGGLVTREGMMEALKQRGKVIALCASPETIYERTRHNSNRPLLQVENPLEKIKELLDLRRPYYSRADMSILTDNRSVQDIIQHIARFCS